MQHTNRTQRSVLALALVALGTGPGGRAAVAQSLVPEPVRQVMVDLDGDRVPDRLGETVLVRGVILSHPLVVGRHASLANFQDATGGAVLFTRDTTLLKGLDPGDSVRVVARVGQYLGAEQLRVDRVERLRAGPDPTPRDVLAAEVMGERFSGRLVRVAGNLRTRATERGWVAELEDRSGTIPLHLYSGWLTDPQFAERLRRGGRAEVVGIAGQESRSDPPVGGYRLIPRSIDDFSLATRPPYGLLGVAALLLALVTVAWWYRRESRRSRQLERLTRDLRWSQDELRSSEERFRSLVENAADTVSILDASSRVLYQSGSVTRMLGWQPDELEDRMALDLVHPDEREEVGLQFGQLTEEGGGTAELDFRFRTRDGSWRRVEVVATNRLHDPAVRGIVCNTRDITHHKELEQRLRNADRMEAVGRLAGGIAHDFNNVLTAQRGHAALAVEQLPPRSPARAELEEIIRSVDRAADLTRQLLAFSRQQVVQRRIIAPASVLDRMLPMLRRLIGEDIQLRTEAEPGIASTRMDPVQFEQVVMNLVVNARDAMPSGGRLTLRLANDRIEPEEAASYPYAVTAGEYIRLTVADTGEGMSEEVLSHVFDPFFTTKEQGRGTGLGLATLYGIVKQSGGYVWASSDRGRGSRFDIFLPPVEGVPDADLDPAAGPVEKGHGETILLVEDEASVRRLCQRVLERNGYRVLEAGDPAAALELAEEEEGGFDLLLTDVVMPGMSGGELAQRLRLRHPDLRTLFISGYTEDELVRRGLDAGQASLLEKPFQPNQLLDEIRSALDRPETAVV